MKTFIRDEQIGQLHRRADDLIRRVIEGTIPFGPTMDALQQIIEGGHAAQKKAPAKADAQLCQVFSGCRCTICGAFFADGDNICCNGHQIGVSYSHGVVVA